jgi:hypothetical protein
MSAPDMVPPRIGKAARKAVARTSAVTRSAATRSAATKAVSRNTGTKKITAHNAAMTKPATPKIARHGAARREAAPPETARPETAPAKTAPRSVKAPVAREADPAARQPAASPELERAGEAAAAAHKLAAQMDRALAQGETGFLPADALQALIAAVCRSYAARIESGEIFPPLADRSRVTSTDVMVTASGLLKSANLAVFELGMWQSWTGR